MKKLFSILFLAGSLAAMQSCGNGEGAAEGSSEKVLLRLQPQKGDKKVLTFTVSSKAQGMPMETNISMTTEMTASNVAENGDVEMETKYTHVSMKMNAMGREMGYDSAKDSIDMNNPESMAYLGLASLVNKSLTMTMDKYGKVVKAPDMNSLYPDSLKALLGSDNSQANQMFDNMFSIYPEQEVGVGDSWDRETEMNVSSGPMKMKAKYTIEAIEKDQVVIKMEGDISGDMKDAMGGSMKMTGTMSGKMYIDRKSGWTNKADLTQDLDMKTMGMSMKMTNTILIETK
ncbi:MAG: hypothetical protein K1X56_10805 [Flavobacteriales bacterium]|nr:hypothetical protein [Flavobacteriales bacterium]